MEVKFFRKLSDGLVQLKNPHSKNLDVAVAFVRNDGLDLVSSLGLQITRGVIGDAFSMTEPAAIERLIHGGSEIRIAEVEGGIFHPKVYLMPYDDSLAAFVGSSNLTRGGIESNEEANIVLCGRKKEAPIPGLLDYFTELWNTKSSEANDEWLKRYKARLESLPKSRSITEQEGSRLTRAISLDVAEALSVRANRHWIVVTSPENFRICLANGLWGVNRQTGAINEVSPGDIVTFYVKGWMNFRGVYRVISRPFYDPTKLWPDKLYPWRVRIQPTSQTGNAKVSNLRNALDMIKDPRVWGTYFQREMIPVSRNDFVRILARMRRDRVDRV